MEDASEKKWLIGIDVTTLILVVIYFVYLLITYFTKTGFFKPYNLTPDSTSGLNQFNAEKNKIPLTPENEEKKQKMIADAKLDLSVGLYGSRFNNSRNHATLS